MPKATPAEAVHAVVDKWWQLLHRSILVQLVCSLLMQVAYVAFPAYNFAIALWCLVCCTPKWFTKNPRLTVLVLGAVGVSVVTDVVWISLWVSGRVFYDQFCGQGGVSIVSCGGASDYFPGCSTNRFALFAMLLNDVAKIVSVVAIHRIRSLQLQGKKSGVESHVTPAPVPPALALALGSSSARGTPRSSAVHHQPLTTAVHAPSAPPHDSADVGENDHTS